MLSFISKKYGTQLKLIENHLLFSITHIIVKKVLFLDQTFEMENLADLHVTRFFEAKKFIFSVWFVCMCIRLCVWLYAYCNITQKQITTETSILVFYICIMYRCYLKLFIKIGQKLCVQGTQKNSYTLRPMDGFSC